MPPDLNIQNLLFLYLTSCILSNPFIADLSNFGLELPSSNQLVQVT